MKPPDMVIRTLGPNVTLRVKISTEYKIREWIALRLIKIAVIILGCNIEVES